MQVATKLNPEELFLKVGKGDQRQVVRAIMAIDALGLATGLEIPAQTKTVFSRYVTNEPALPLDDTGNEWVEKGALASDKKTHYNDLESKYIDQHYDTIINAVKSFIAT